MADEKDYQPTPEDYLNRAKGEIDGLLKQFSQGDFSDFVGRTYSGQWVQLSSEEYKKLKQDAPPKIIKNAGLSFEGKLNDIWEKLILEEAKKEATGTLFRILDPFRPPVNDGFNETAMLQRIAEKLECEKGRDKRETCQKIEKAVLDRIQFVEKDGISRVQLPKNSLETIRDIICEEADHLEKSPSSTNFVSKESPQGRPPPSPPTQEVSKVKKRNRSSQCRP